MIFNSHNIVRMLNENYPNKQFSSGHSLTHGFFIEDTTGISNAIEYMAAEQHIKRVYLQADIETTITECKKVFNL